MCNIYSEEKNLVVYNLTVNNAHTIQKNHHYSVNIVSTIFLYDTALTAVQTIYLCAFIDRCSFNKYNIFMCLSLPPN